MAHAMKARQTARFLSKDDDVMAFELVPESSRRPKITRSFRAGELFENRYRVLGAAAPGGMGIVYVCEDTLLARPVAVKFMRSGNASEQSLAERFFAEARITAQLHSPHIATLFDCATLRTGESYMVMELVEGADLFSILRTEGPLSPERVMRYAMQVCAGLREAHSKGIVHCDLKPENLIVTRTPEMSEVVKIIDFGVARQRRFPCVRSLADPDIACGSPNYMAPEQIRTPGDVDARTDIWALGVVMFELLTGGLPFTGSNELRICRSVVDDPVPPITTLAIDISPELEAIVSRCLQKNPADRFADVDELTLALANAVLQELARVRRAEEVTDPGPEAPAPEVDVPAVTVPASVGVRVTRTKHVVRGLVMAVLLGSLRSDAPEPYPSGIEAIQSGATFKLSSIPKNAR